MSFKDAEFFVRSKEDWILKHLPKIKRLEESKIIFDETTSFKTKEHQLLIKKHDGIQTLVIIDDYKITVQYPATKDVKSEDIQKEIKLGIDAALRIEAKKHLPMRVRELAHLHGLKYNKLFIKNLKSRWGSCSVRDNINLNIHLMQLPNDLIDYVILHELVHTIHKNHSKNFWNKLGKLLPNYRELDKSLRNYSPQNYLHKNI